MPHKTYLKNKIIDVRDEMPRKIVGKDYHHRDCPGPSRKKSVTQRDLTHISEAEGNRINAVALISGTASRLPSRAPSRHLPPNNYSGHESIGRTFTDIVTSPDYTLSKLDLANKSHISRGIRIHNEYLF